MTRSRHRTIGARFLAVSALAAIGCSSEEAELGSSFVGDAALDGNVSGAVGGGSSIGSGGTAASDGGSGGTPPTAGGVPGSHEAGIGAASGGSSARDSGPTARDGSPDVGIVESGPTLEGGGIASDAGTDGGTADGGRHEVGTFDAAGCNDAGDCDDGNECTVDTCLSDAVCQHVPRPDGWACTGDNNPCTMDWCSGGVCNAPVSADWSVLCRSSACVDGPTESVATLAGYCDGTPTCPEPVSVSCEGMYCNLTGTACATYCFDTSECRPGYLCTGPGSEWGCYPE